MADETEFFYTSVSKQPVIAGALVSVNDLHAGLSSFVFRVEQITQNPVVAIPCGFDPRFRHQKVGKPCLFEVRFFEFLPVPFGGRTPWSDPPGDDLEVRPLDELFSTLPASGTRKSENRASLRCGFLSFARAVRGVNHSHIIKFAVYRLILGGHSMASQHR